MYDAAITNKDIENKNIRQIRRRIIDMTFAAGTVGAHIGGSLSAVEILYALYFAVLNIAPDNLASELRDRLVLSKGHAAMCLYAVLKQVGILTDEDIASFKKDGLSFSAHPFMNLEKGIEFSSGSLGQGLSLGVGTALALKLKKNDTSRVFVLLGDGELNEGQVWEAAMSAAHYRLDHLVLIVDKNDLQLDGFTKDIMSTSDVTAKFQAFGWETVCADGHSVPDIVTALSVAHDEKPLAVIAETTKGKGVSFIENSIAWHNGRLSQSQYEQALSEVGGI